MADNFRLDNLTICDFQISAITVIPDRPEIQCVVTAPATVSGVVSILVLFFDQSDRGPYASVTVAYPVAAGKSLQFIVDQGDGRKPPANKFPHEVEIQLTVTATIADAKRVSHPVKSGK